MQGTARQKTHKKKEVLAVVKIRDSELHRGPQTHKITFKTGFFQLSVIVNH